jgi:hypothetical protein
MLKNTRIFQIRFLDGLVSDVSFKVINFLLILDSIILLKIFPEFNSTRFKKIFLGSDST